MRHPTYKLARHPRDRQWYVMGSCGNGKYMQVSDGYGTSKEANERMRLIIGSERAAKAELCGWNCASIND